MLELRHLRTLVAIAETGRLSAAASRVHLTQSALSHQLRALEERYGPLLDRSRNGLSFTAAGTRLLHLARATLESVADAERDIARMKDAGSGELRIALECHTCFDWLMPVMDRFRRRWPEVELDLVAGFHSDALDLLGAGKADIVIGSRPPRRSGVVAVPLFRFEILAVLPVDHPLRGRAYLEAKDFAGRTLITYPVPEKRIDIIRDVLAPAKVRFSRRTAELTIAILQLVASKRGIAALPSWGLASYLEHGYVIAKPIGRRGLHSDLYAIGAAPLMSRHFALEFVEVIRDCGRGLESVTLLGT
jgi:LysR family transcriptional regulator, regulator for metE and metH